VVECNRHVRDVALAEQSEHRAGEPERGADLFAVQVRARRIPVVGAEQLERSVDEMHVHDGSSPLRCAQ
jgi:hypothetical protein